MPDSLRLGGWRIATAVGSIALAFSATAHAQAPREARCAAAQLESELRAGRIPDVKGCSFDEVQPVLRRFDHPPQRIPATSALAPGTISDQDPPAGAARRSATKVTLWVSDGSASPPPVPAASADLSVSATIDPAGPYQVGQSIKYWIVVRNAGPSTATRVRLDSRVENLAVARIYGACSGFPCDIVDLNPESSASVFIAATIDRNGSFGVEAAAEAAEADPDEQNNRTRLADESVAPPVVTPPPTKPPRRVAPPIRPGPSDTAPRRPPDRPVAAPWLGSAWSAALVLVVVVIAFLAARHWRRRRKLERMKRRVSVRVREPMTVGRPTVQDSGAPLRCLALRIRTLTRDAKVLSAPPLENPT